MQVCTSSYELTPCFQLSALLVYYCYLSRAVHVQVVCPQGRVMTTIRIRSTQQADSMKEKGPHEYEVVKGSKNSARRDLQMDRRRPSLRAIRFARRKGSRKPKTMLLRPCKTGTTIWDLSEGAQTPAGDLQGQRVQGIHEHYTQLLTCHTENRQPCDLHVETCNKQVLLVLCGFYILDL